MVPGIYGRLITHIICYNCGKKGQYADNYQDLSCSIVDQQHYVQFKDNINNTINEDDEN